MITDHCLFNYCNSFIFLTIIKYEVKGYITNHHLGFISRKMPQKIMQLGKVVEITYKRDKVDSNLRLNDSLGTSSAHSPILISSEGNVKDSIEHRK